MKALRLFYAALIGLLIAIALSGCAALKYDSPKYGRVSYYRFWSQEIGHVTISVDGKKVIIGLDSQKAIVPDVKDAATVAAGIAGVL